MTLFCHNVDICFSIGDCHIENFRLVTRNAPPTSPKTNVENVSLLSLKGVLLSNWQRLEPKLNDSQRKVIKRILAPEDVSSPLVVFGPFGTGKTFTLNQAIRELVTRESNRVLLCTHTNSAADIHVKLLHEYLTEHNGLKATQPLRIYQPKRRY